MVPIRAVPTKTFTTVFIVNSIPEPASAFLQNAECKDCGFGLSNGLLGNWHSGVLGSRKNSSEVPTA